jgi:hypothetical protein
MNAAASAELPDGVLTKLKDEGRELRHGIVMVDPDALSEDVGEALDGVGALQPVFGSRDTGLVVVLPELRIETDSEAAADDVKRFLESSDIDAEVVRDTHERMVVRPSSGRGMDALQLANSVVEAVHPSMAQARLLRVVPRP